MATSTVKPACSGLDREVVLYGLVKVRSTARSATIGGGARGGQIGSSPLSRNEAFSGKTAENPLLCVKSEGFRE